VCSDPRPPPSDLPERDLEAETAAEVAITDRRLLRELGFLAPKRSAREEQEQP
jgi:hypothetical protein